MEKSPVRPIFDRVLVRPDKTEELTDGGIVKPDIGLEKPMQGVVIDKGSKVIEVQVGEHVCFGKYSGTELNIEDVRHIILREDEILGVIEEQAKVALA